MLFEVGLKKVKNQYHAKWGDGLGEDRDSVIQWGHGSAQAYRFNSVCDIGTNGQRERAEH